jgi:hypothetical protein
VRPRTNFCQHDALTFDYHQVPAQIDYLQIDINPSTNNLLLLNQVLPHHTFSVITFEHDAWDHTPESATVRKQSRSLLKSYGYRMVISDATVPPGHGNGIADEPINFEDWWVNPEVISNDIVMIYENLCDHGQPKYYYDTLFSTD